MTIVSIDTPIAEAVTSDCSIIPVLNRLGINLGFAERTVGEIAAAHGIDPQFLVTIINTFRSDDYFPATALRSLDITVMVRYFELTDGYYEHFLIPNVERHFDALMQSHDGNPSLTLLRRLFDDARGQLLLCLKDDRNELFPALRALAATDGSHAARRRKTPWDSVEEILSDLLGMIVKHISGDFNPNLCYATVVAINNLATDVKKNNRIRNLLLQGADSIRG